MQYGKRGENNDKRGRHRKRKEGYSSKEKRLKPQCLRANIDGPKEVGGSV
ncbi:hypothetical protein YSKK_34720 [Halopseudomonas aestusnigri]|nr:hypothetical protein YSKK_34720 [Halopseudomonas aestusnigri]